MSGAAAVRNTDDGVVQLCSLQGLQSFFEKLGKTPVLFDTCDAPAVTQGDCSGVVDQNGLLGEMFSFLDFLLRLI